jgi:NAD(P)-dependent dehydrogenase (short-subunit alcohol dehydrogenase family)
MFDITGLTAIVTGAAQGIGRGIAKALSQAGAHVLLVDRDEAALAAAVESLATTSTGAVEAVTQDVTAADAGARVVAACTDRFGRLDLLVNNAGRFPMARLEALEQDLFTSIIDLNLRSMIFLSKAAAVIMREQVESGGSLVNIGSLDGLRPTFEGLTAYGASKAAVMTATRHMARELAADGIRVNTVVPGSIWTEGSQTLSESSEEAPALLAQVAAKVPLGRWGTPADVAGAVVFLASPAASYITGATLLVDGGMVLG